MKPNHEAFGTLEAPDDFRTSKEFETRTALWSFSEASPSQVWKLFGRFLGFASGLLRASLGFLGG